MWAGFVCMFVCLAASTWIFLFIVFEFCFQYVLLTVFAFFNGSFLNTTIKMLK